MISDNISTGSFDIEPEPQPYVRKESTNPTRWAVVEEEPDIAYGLCETTIRKIIEFMNCAVFSLSQISIDREEMVDMLYSKYRGIYKDVFRKIYDKWESNSFDIDKAIADIKTPVSHVGKKHHTVNVKGILPQGFRDTFLRRRFVDITYGYSQLYFYGTDEEFDDYLGYLVKNEGRLGFKII